MGTAGAMHSAPILNHFKLPSKLRLGKMVVTELKYMKRIIKEYQTGLDPDNPRDFTDAYLNEIQNSNQSHICDGNLPDTLIHLFSAGTENISTTLRWALLYMIANPDIQAKVQEEMDRVVGRDRMPQLSDEASLPYTGATLLELQRMSSVAPLGVAHMSTNDVNIQGYTIPARTTVIPNTWAIHYNPKVWKEPAKFNPERFLDKQRKVTGGEGIVSFSAGKQITNSLKLFLFVN